MKEVQLYTMQVEEIEGAGESYVIRRPDGSWVYTISRDDAGQALEILANLNRLSESRAAA